MKAWKQRGCALLCVALGLSGLVFSTAGGVAHAADYSDLQTDVQPFGPAGYFGATTALNFNQPIVGLAQTPYSTGYWEAATDGAVYTFGRARFYGSMGGKHLNQPIVGIASPFAEKGYWLAARDGGVFTFGHARYYGSMGGVPLNQPVVAMAATPTGHGYWLVAADGGVFAFGDAPYFGSTGGKHLNQPIVGFTPTSTGRGYWLVARDGGVFSFGDARFLGSAVARSADVVGIAQTLGSTGYWIADVDGRVFSFGRAPVYGDAPASGVSRPVVAIVSSANNIGYWLVGRGSANGVPGPVSQLHAGHAGGSGEIQLRWTGVSGATGYRVSRAPSASGPFTVTADIDLTTGTATTIDIPRGDLGSVVYLGSDAQGYVPRYPATPIPAATATSFSYIDIITAAGPRSYYEVTAYNAAGDASPSAVVCGSPVGYPAC